MAFKITDKTIEKIEESASRGLSKEQIAHSLGMSLSTLYRHAELNPKIDEAIQKGKAVGIKTIANALFENAKNGNVTAQIFFLKTQALWKDTEAAGPQINIEKLYQQVEAEASALPHPASYHHQPARFDA